jgi:hypothetical protein
MVKVKTKTKKAIKKQIYNRIYSEYVVPFVLERDRICKRCNLVHSQECHHRKGRDSFQEGDLVEMLEEIGVKDIDEVCEQLREAGDRNLNQINLTIYTPLIMGACSDCHRYIETNREESYREMWLYNRNCGQLPKGWQEKDWVLHPELRPKRFDLSEVIDLTNPLEVAAFNDFLQDSAKA